MRARLRGRTVRLTALATCVVVPLLVAFGALGANSASPVLGTIGKIAFASNPGVPKPGEVPRPPNGPPAPPPPSYWDIYSINEDGTDLTRLTKHGANAFAAAPKWSADGTRIAFESRWDIFVMKADGSGQTNLTNSSSIIDRRPSWSPDGRIAFASARSVPPHLFVMNDDGSGLKQLTFGSALDDDPAWSPDGERIAFTRWSDYNPNSQDIWLLDVSSLELTRLTDNPFRDTMPAWSPTEPSSHSRAPGTSCMRSPS